MGALTVACATRPAHDGGVQITITALASVIRFMITRQNHSLGSSQVSNHSA